MFTKFFFSIGLLIFVNCSYANIVAPEPPPELFDTLKDYKTALQEKEQYQSLEHKERTEDFKIGKLPAVPGDVQAGVIRLGGVYEPNCVIGVPSYGISILRIYDLDGNGFEIERFQSENPAFAVDSTATSYELLIKQNPGALVGKLKVILKGRSKPLIFRLKPVNLEQEGVLVKTILNSIKMGDLIRQGEIFKPNLENIPKPNPLDKQKYVNYEDHDKIEKNLVKAIENSISLLQKP